jgi:hypothetical protein
MKIRNGFVSNSSSSSFTCDVCGESQSGMDMGLSEAGMFECENGHTCCESHQLETKEISIKEKRKRLVSEVKNSYYYKTSQREELDEIANLDDSEVDDRYEDTVSDSGHAAKKLTTDWCSNTCSKSIRPPFPNCSRN